LASEQKAGQARERRSPLFGDVKMLGRVAACGFAAFLVVVPARIGIEITSAKANVIAAAATGAATPDPVELQNLPANAAGNKTVTATEAIADTDAEIGNQPDAKVENKTADPIVAAEIAAEGQDRSAAEAQPQTKLSSLEPAAPALPSPRAEEPFGLAATPISSGGVLTKWRGVEADIRADNEILARCRGSNERCPAAARGFLSIVEQGHALSGRARIGVINRAINLAIQPMSDLAQWGVPDRWSAPLETFGTGRGDCEDYAIAKYVALTEAGVAAVDVKLVIVRDTAADEDHAVVAVRLDGSWIVLDNRRLALVEAAAMPEVIPLFVLDRDGVRRFAPPMLAARHTSAPASLGF
jgi:predicted transglutaminase-like cysteine proteinase